MLSFQTTTPPVLRAAARLVDLTLPLYTIARPILQFPSSSEAWSFAPRGSLDLINFPLFFGP